MIERIKGIIILLPLISALILGGNLLYLTAFIIGFFGIKELFSAFRKKDFNPMFITGISFCLFLLFDNVFNLPIKLTLLTCFILFIYSSILVILKRNTIIDFLITIFGILYILLPIQLIIKTYEVSNTHFNLAWIIFVISFSNDIFAYLTGKLLGKNKLIPSISPNKTIEGSIGGILGSLITVLTISYIFKLEFLSMGTLSILGSIVSQIGDLFASSVKRYLDLKDFSDLIPGHGGIIDRFDSVLFLSPLVYIITFFL